MFIKYNKNKNYFYTHLIYNNLFHKKFNDNNKVFSLSLNYANINYFFRALYELPIIKNHFYLNHLQNKVLIFVQTQVFYIDLIDYIIINKTNNIPVPFDLFITTNTEEKNQKIF